MKRIVSLCILMLFIAGCQEMGQLSGFSVNKKYPEMLRGVANGDPFGYRTLDSLREKGIVLADTREGTAIVLSADKFLIDQVNRVVINPNFQPALNDLVHVLEAYPKVKLSVIGHSDDVMNRAMQEKQSEAFAIAVADYLTSAGISALRIQAVHGVGAREPVFPDGNEFVDHTLNRRVEVITSMPLK